MVRTPPPPIPLPLPSIQEDTIQYVMNDKKSTINLSPRLKFQGFFSLKKSDKTIVNTKNNWINRLGKYYQRNTCSV